VEIDHCIDFENGVAKLQNNEEAKRTAGDKKSLKVLLIPTDHGNDLGSNE